MYSINVHYMTTEHHMIQLAAICESENIAKYSLDAVLQPHMISRNWYAVLDSVSSVMCKNEGSIIYLEEIIT